MKGNSIAGQVILFVLLAGVISSCGPSRRAKKRVQLDTITVSAKNNPLDIYRETSTRSWELVNSHVALSFNYKDKTAQGKEWITMHPYFYTTDSIVLDAKTMKIDSVYIEDVTEGKTLSYSYHDDQLYIKLHKKYSASDTIKLYIKYTAMSYSGKAGGSSAIAEDKGLYFINTDNAIPNKPVQVWTQGETESNSRWLPTIDKPNQRTTTRLELTVADSFTTLSNGNLEHQFKSANGMRTDVWVMDKPIQVYAIMFAIGKFSIVADKDWNGKPVNYYVEPAYAPYAKTMFKHTPDMIGYFSEVTGVPYPWNKYSQVVVRDYVSGAMENTSATLLGEFLNQNNRENKDEDFEDVVSHELFHQWFGDYVTAESWSNLTLNESFATYGEQLWRRHQYGNASADLLLWKDLNTYLSSAQINQPLVRFHYRDREDMFDRVSYQKGGAILHYLHSLMGDEAFSRSMQLYLQKHALHPAEATQWRLAVEEVTGQDWNWFFNQWYYKGGHPKLDIKYRYDDDIKQLAVTVAQTQDGGNYRLPMKTAVCYGTDKELVDWNITDKNTTLFYPYKDGKRPLLIPDVQHWVVGEISEDKISGDWLATFKNSTDDIIDKIKALNSINKKYDDTANQSIINLALQDKDYAIKTTALAMLDKITASQYQNKWTSTVQYLADNDGSNKVRAAALEVLGDWKVSKAKDKMYAALNDSSYLVAGAALGALNEFDKDTTYKLSKAMLANEPKGELESVIWDIIGERAKDDDVALFENRMPYYYGNKKIQLASGLADYLANVTSSKSFDRGLDVFRSMVKSEPINSYRSSIGTYLITVAVRYKDKKKKARTNADVATYESRIDAVKTATEEMIKNETDEGTKSTFRNYYKIVFE
ncbi:MAG: M1 family metallopeptidase [Bacteroidetes bacterium]|nr:M1 family metallopeptidase [Bacteroidota bacterium]